MTTNGEVDAQKVIGRLCQQIAQLNYELAVRDALIEQLQATEENPQLEVSGADHAGA